MLCFCVSNCSRSWFYSHPGLCYHSVCYLDQWGHNHSTNEIFFGLYGWFSANNMYIVVSFYISYFNLNSCHILGRKSDLVYRETFVKSESDTFTYIGSTILLMVDMLMIYLLFLSINERIKRHPFIKLVLLIPKCRKGCVLYLGTV